MRRVTEADTFGENFLFHRILCKFNSLNDSRRHFKAGDVFAAGLDRPMNDELNFGINLEHPEGVFVDVGFALLQLTTGLLAAFIEEIVAR